MLKKAPGHLSRRGSQNGKAKDRDSIENIVFITINMIEGTEKRRSRMVTQTHGGKEP
jgi:hypothetical protein